MIMDDSFATSGRDGATRVPFTNSRPLTCWAEEDLGIEICIAPVLVCSQVCVFLSLYLYICVIARRPSRQRGVGTTSLPLAWWFRFEHRT